MPSPLANIDWNTVLQAPDTLLFLVLPTAAVAIILSLTIAIQWRKAQQAKYDAELKLRMIERGFTAEEIKTVISASLGRAPRRVGIYGIDLQGLCGHAGRPAAEEAGQSASAGQSPSCC